MEPRTTTRPRTSRAVDALAVIAGSSWGAVAGGVVFGFTAAALGAGKGTGPGEIIPGFGWNQFTAFLVGLPVGFVAGALVALHASRRWPLLIGVPVAIVGALVIVSGVAAFFTD